MSIEEQKDAINCVLNTIKDGYIDISYGWGCEEDVYSIEFIEEAVRKHYFDVFCEEPQ